MIKGATGKLAGSETEISEAVLAAVGASSPIEIRGGGTRLGLGRPTGARSVLDISGHSGVTLYEPGALTLVAKSGTPLSEVEAILKGEGQRLAFEPMDHRPLLKSRGEPTVGGTVAINNSGPRRIQGGACRDTLIGVRFVNGNGEIVKNGGRVMKNVTGYDLVKLMCGTYGTLGVLTEVSFKVLPQNERQASLVLSGLSLNRAVGAMTKALGLPYDISGAAHFPNEDGGYSTVLRIEGFEKQVDYRIKKLKDQLRDDCVVLEGAAHDAIWQRVRNVEMFAASQKPVWKISIKPSDAPIIGETLIKEIDAEISLDWGGGLLWVAVNDHANGSADFIRKQLAQVGGHATLIRGSEELRTAIPVFQPQVRRIAELSKDLRRNFDPAGVLNPGRMAA